METRKKIRGWKEGILTEDICSAGGSGHKKGSIVRYRRYAVTDTEGHYTGEYEWHYLDQSNYNLVRIDELLIESSEKK